MEDCNPGLFSVSQAKCVCPCSIDASYPFICSLLTNVWVGGRNNCKYMQCLGLYREQMKYNYEWERVRYDYKRNKQSTTTRDNKQSTTTRKNGWSTTTSEGQTVYVECPTEVQDPHYCFIVSLNCFSHSVFIAVYTVPQQAERHCCHNLSMLFPDWVLECSLGTI